MLPYDRRLKERSQQLREAMTAAEELLWNKIRTNQVKGYRFYRQKPIGEYIADFYCPKAKLVVEVDGGQHFTDGMIEYDRVRNKYMEGLGLVVKRFTNTEVMTNIKGVLEIIESELD
jgi:very-short-patch-repair endonuclease